MGNLERVCSLVFPDKNITDTQKELLKNIVELVEERLKSYLPKKYEVIPKQLNYIVIEVSIKRFNRVGSEGMQSESVEGHSATYLSRDFDEYLEDIDRFLKEDDEDGYYSDKVVRFL
ncbi:phage head-tail connector protein [uncultured Finegoldia sp.]|uniref:phage head-tail connector protein n=1 Tax=uncultured Finegoldia sp. TaxID=328009 RepID=UPI002805AB6A|nr:phage head-tail connector protein [uncultured Finegoldia sp.]MDU1409786.1 phage head-tail connector protein [Veillonella sp.]